jgi:hypothetical protein
MDMIFTGLHGEKNRLKIFSQLGHLLPQLSLSHYPTICCDFEILVIVGAPPPKTGKISRN